MTAQAQARVFADFWSWLSRLRASATADGLTFRACWYDADAENAQLRRIAPAAGRPDEIASFIESDEWVDLSRGLGRQLVTRCCTGLKNVASLAASHRASRILQAPNRWPTTTVPSGQATSRHANGWLAGNRSDVEATPALREWPDQGSAAGPSVETPGS